MNKLNVREQEKDQFVHNICTNV